MTKLATSGMSSCATAAISGFKNGQKKLNEDYKKDKTSFKTPSVGMSVTSFFDKMIVPVSQPLGATYDMPFEKLMEDIGNSSMKTKFIVAALNSYQYMGDEKYWHGELKRWGFKLKFKTNNALGVVNYIYVRNPNAVAIKEGEE